MQISEKALIQAGHFIAAQWWKAFRQKIIMHSA